jgi:hypothetical protein
VPEPDDITIQTEFKDGDVTVICTYSDSTATFHMPAGADADKAELLVLKFAQCVEAGLAAATAAANGGQE